MQNSFLFLFADIWRPIRRIQSWRSDLKRFNESISLCFLVLICSCILVASDPCNYRVNCYSKDIESSRTGANIYCSGQRNFVIYFPPPNWCVCMCVCVCVSVCLCLTVCACVFVCGNFWESHFRSARWKSGEEKWNFKEVFWWLEIPFVFRWNLI